MTSTAAMARAFIRASFVADASDTGTSIALCAKPLSQQIVPPRPASSPIARVLSSYPGLPIVRRDEPSEQQIVLQGPHASALVDVLSRCGSRSRGTVPEAVALQQGHANLRGPYNRLFDAETARTVAAARSSRRCIDPARQFGSTGGRPTSGSISPVSAFMSSMRSACSWAVSPRGRASSDNHGFFTPPRL